MPRSLLRSPVSNDVQTYYSSDEFLIMFQENILKSNRLFELLPIFLSRLESVDPHTRALGYFVANALLSKLSGEHQVDVASRVLEVVKLEEISGVEDLSAERDPALEVCLFFGVYEQG